MPTYSVPASTTNLGHGFDCHGIALGLTNRITVTPTTDGAVSAPGAADPGLAGLAAAVRERCVAAWNRALPGFAVSVAGEVPIARGMGSSATIIVGVAAACRSLAKLPMDPGALLDVAAAVEGHPDNVAAACLGGVTVIAGTPGGWRWTRLAPPTDLVAVLAIPPFEVKTSEARRILPQTLTRAEAVRGWQRSALITAAFADPGEGLAERLRGLFDDAWHEQYRAGVNPGLVEARAAAAAAGAAGTILSGSGSTVLSFASRKGAQAVAAAVLASYAARGVAAEVRVVPFSADGVKPVGD
jgi:homoserine kinase